MTATLSATLDIPGLGPTEIMVEYEFPPRMKELYIESVTAILGGVETCVWDRLTSTQRYSLDDACVADYYEKMENRRCG